MAYDDLTVIHVAIEHDGHLHTLTTRSEWDSSIFGISWPWMCRMMTQQLVEAVAKEVD